MVSNLVLWRLSHPNGQSAHCSLVGDADKWHLRRWLDGFVAGAEDFREREKAIDRAAELRRGLESRGFREE